VFLRRAFVNFFNECTKTRGSISKYNK